MSWILGISAFFHDSAAALIEGGRIVAAAQEERFTRRKGDARFPANAIRSCLSQAGIQPSDLSAVTLYEKPFVKYERLLETYLAFAPNGYRSFREAFSSSVRKRGEFASGLATHCRGFDGDVLFAQHHDAHAASAFYPSPFEEAAILTLDATGEWGTSSYGTGRGNRIELTHELRFPHSLGMLYSAFTYYTGFKVNSGEYKVMGLAPYGTPKYVNTILEHVADLAEDGSLWLDMSYFNYCQGLTMTSDKFHRLFGGPPRKPESMITQKEIDLAASIQKVCEKAVMRAAGHVHRETGMRRLVLAGGVALNCVANGRLRVEGPFEDIWIQPAAGDAGGALGAALLTWHEYFNQPRGANPADSQRGSLLGPSFRDDDIRLFLDSIGARYATFEDERQLLDHVVELLEQEKVIGWFHGPMEYGPRALGARSIIGDPRSRSMQQTMNVKIKFRESFRPFAPCVLEEHAAEIFEFDEGQTSPYMLLVAPVREEWRAELTEEAQEKMRSPDLRIRVAVPRSTLPAITHVDYSARVQTVDAERHGRFHRLMQRFHQRTGCPVVVNTSFNIRGEPIVCSFEDAFRCFLATDMDCLVLENSIVTKNDVGGCLPQRSDVYMAQYALD